MIKILAACCTALLGAAVAATINILVCLLLSANDPDPTVGGAYAALALLTSPIAAAFGALVGAFIGSKL